MAKMHKPSDKCNMEKPASGGAKAMPKPAESKPAAFGKGNSGSMGKGIASKNKKYGY